MESLKALGAIIIIAKDLQKVLRLTKLHIDKNINTDKVTVTVELLFPILYICKILVVVEINRYSKHCKRPVKHFNVSKVMHPFQ